MSLLGGGWCWGQRAGGGAGGAGNPGGSEKETVNDGEWRGENNEVGGELDRNECFISNM